MVGARGVRPRPTRSSGIWIPRLYRGRVFVTMGGARHNGPTGRGRPAADASVTTNQVIGSRVGMVKSGRARSIRAVSRHILAPGRRTSTGLARDPRLGIQPRAMPLHFWLEPSRRLRMGSTG